MEVSYTPDEKRFCKDCRYYDPVSREGSVYSITTKNGEFFADRCLHELNKNLVDGGPRFYCCQLRYDQFGCSESGDWWEAK